MIGTYAACYYNFDTHIKRFVLFPKRPRFSKLFDDCRFGESPYLVLGNSIFEVLRKEYLISNCKDIKYSYFLRRISRDEFVYLMSANSKIDKID